MAAQRLLDDELPRIRPGACGAASMAALLCTPANAGRYGVPARNALRFAQGPGGRGLRPQNSVRTPPTGRSAVSRVTGLGASVRRAARSVLRACRSEPQIVSAAEDFDEHGLPFAGTGRLSTTSSSRGAGDGFPLDKRTGHRLEHPVIESGLLKWRILRSAGRRMVLQLGYQNSFRCSR